MSACAHRLLLTLAALGELETGLQGMLVRADSAHEGFWTAAESTSSPLGPKPSLLCQTLWWSATCSRYMFTSSCDVGRCRTCVELAHPRVHEGNRGGSSNPVSAYCIKASRSACVERDAGSFPVVMGTLSMPCRAHATVLNCANHALLKVHAPDLGKRSIPEDPRP